jgi:hypothetical protein
MFWGRFVGVFFHPPGLFACSPWMFSFRVSKLVWRC